MMLYVIFDNNMDEQSKTIHFISNYRVNEIKGQYLAFQMEEE